MIVDPSALIAVLNDEPDAPRYARALAEAPSVSMSAVGFVEASVVADASGSPAIRRRFDTMLRGLGVVVREVSVEQALLARDAYRDYGKGSGSLARLNFGDCFSYALAMSRDEPLLFKGDDFVHTDVRIAEVPD